MNIKSKDLNLLIIFKALFEELNVSKVARRLALSQPAVSHALGRLRNDFADPLFVRGSKGMVPTKIALALGPQISELVRQAEGVYGAGRTFDPRLLTGSFQVAATEFMEQAIGPKLISQLITAAPNLKMVFRPTVGLFPAADLEKGTLDLAIAGFFGDLPDGFVRKKLMVEKYLCVLRKGHPAVKGGKIDLISYAGLTHVLTSPQGDLQGAVDLALAALKMTRRVQGGFSSFFAPGWVVESSDAVLTTPARMARIFAKHLEVECYELPFALPAFTIFQVWHHRSQDEAGHIWVREMIEKICRESVESG